MTVSSYGYNSFYRKVGIMGKMAGEVIRTQRVVGILSMLDEIVSPGGHYFAMFSGIFGILLHARYRIGPDNHIPGLCHRHITPIGLSTGKRISADIMRRKR